MAKGQQTKETTVPEAGGSRLWVIHANGQNMRRCNLSICLQFRASNDANRSQVQSKRRQLLILWVTDSWNLLTKNIMAVRSLWVQGKTEEMEL